MHPRLTIENIERHSFVTALHAMRAWPITDLFEFIESESERAQTLGTITIGEFVLCADKLRREELMLELANEASGKAFDFFALAVLHEIYPKSAKAAYLTQRLGGPRWKLQAAMGRLLKQGKIARSGETSARRYVARRDAMEELRGY